MRFDVYVARLVDIDLDQAIAQVPQRLVIGQTADTGMGRDNDLVLKFVEVAISVGQLRHRVVEGGDRRSPHQQVMAVPE